jgi:hypothetical protein
MRSKYGPYLFFLVLSFGVLFVCSASSPLYPINDWTDVNTYFTMGKGVVHGRIPYRDLFDHKGPLLYLLYAVGYLISRDTAAALRTSIFPTA